MSTRVIGLSIITAATLAAVMYTAGHPQTVKPKSDKGVVYDVPETSATQLDKDQAGAKHYIKVPSGQVQAGIIPHHLLVSPIISAYFAGLKNQPTPHTVVVVGPDHPDAGKNIVTTSLASWQTPLGRVEPSSALIHGLIVKSLAVPDEAVVQTEHSVYTPLPYIQQTWPSAQVVLLALRSDATAERVQAIAEYLDEHLGSSDHVIASVDFSHYKDITGAYRDDAESLPIISSMNSDAALHIPADSPASISLVIRYAKLRHLSFQQLVHTNSAEYIGDASLTSTTSYLSAYFTKE